MSGGSSVGGGGGVYVRGGVGRVIRVGKISSGSIGIL